MLAVLVSGALNIDQRYRLTQIDRQEGPIRFEAAKEAVAP